MKKWLKWFWMLSKRLYKKSSFWALLMLIPLCVALFAGAAQEDSGLVRIALAQEQADDPVAAAIMDALMEENRLFYFQRMRPQEAMEAVKTGKIDEAWVFPENTEGALQSYASGKGKYIVTTITREETMTVKLAREKLSAMLYPYCARAYYIEYVRTHFSQLDHLTDQELIIYFDEVKVTEELFTYGNPVDVSDAEEGNYLTSPIRGLLAIVMFLCAMAAVLYYFRDEAAGTFAWVRQSRKGFTALCCTVTAALNVSVVLFLSLLFSGLTGNLFREAAALLLYSLCCASFCLVLKQIFANIWSFAAIVPLVAVVMLALCPVFYDFRGWYLLQLLLPPTYYINACYDRVYLLYMLAYIPACLGVAFVLSQVRRLFRRK